MPLAEVTRAELEEIGFTVESCRNKAVPWDYMKIGILYKASLPTPFDAILLISVVPNSKELRSRIMWRATVLPWTATRTTIDCKLTTDPTRPTSTRQHTYSS